MKQKNLSHEKISVSQISNIESGLQLPSAEKFMTLLKKLNVTYDEFIFLMNDDDVTVKSKMNKQLSEFIGIQNLEGLARLAKEATHLFTKSGDLYFQHMTLIALATVQLLKSYHDFESARHYLVPIKEYLNKIVNWGYYELTLISRCLFVFEIEEAISYGERALQLIEKNASLYKNEKLECILLLTLTTYILDYEPYYHLALKYSQMAIDLATIRHDITSVLLAKANYQFACFKLANTMYSEEKLFSVLRTFKLLEWHHHYQHLKKLIQKHGIVFTSC